MYISVEYCLRCDLFKNKITENSRECNNHKKKKKKKKKNDKRKVEGVLQSQNAALPRHQKEEKTDKSKQTQNEQTNEKH